jgi:Uncharacterized conserved protein
MARPTNKEELIALSNDNYNKLKQLVDGFSPEAQAGIFPFEDRDRNIRDVLVHLHEWHLMMEKWYNVGMSGEKPTIPAAGYTWQTIPQLNRVIWEKWQPTDLETSKQLLEESHKRIMQLIESHTNDELFTKKVYKWTNTTSLGAYFIGATSSHYDWAMKKIKKYKKAI